LGINVIFWSCTAAEVSPEVPEPPLHAVRASAAAAVMATSGAKCGGRPGLFRFNIIVSFSLVVVRF
jgi:hypothetical protein